jgi:hypothetical protein
MKITEVLQEGWFSKKSPEEKAEKELKDNVRMAFNEIDYMLAQADKNDLSKLGPTTRIFIKPVVDATKDSNLANLLDDIVNDLDQWPEENTSSLGLKIITRKFTNLKNGLYKHFGNIIN